MLFIVLGIVLFFVLYFMEFSRFSSLVLSAFLCFLFWGFCTLSVFELSNESDFTYETTETVKICCINEDEDAQEKYYIFSGEAEEDYNYYFIKDISSLGQTREKTSIDRVYINYVDDNFRVETINPEYKNNFISFWLWADLSLENQYKIYIPEGSITTVNKYKINLE